MILQVPRMLSFHTPIPRPLWPHGTPSPTASGANRRGRTNNQQRKRRLNRRHFAGKPWKGHLEGEQPYLGVVGNHLLTGMIFQVGTRRIGVWNQVLEKKNAVTFSWFWLNKPFFSVEEVKDSNGSLRGLLWDFLGVSTFGRDALRTFGWILLRFFNKQIQECAQSSQYSQNVSISDLSTNLHTTFFGRNVPNLFLVVLFWMLKECAIGKNYHYTDPKISANPHPYGWSKNPYTPEDSHNHGGLVQVIFLSFHGWWL